MGDGTGGLAMTPPSLYLEAMAGPHRTEQLLCCHSQCDLSGTLGQPVLTGTLAHQDSLLGGEFLERSVAEPEPSHSQ